MINQFIILLLCTCTVYSCDNLKTEQNDILTGKWVGTYKMKMIGNDIRGNPNDYETLMNSHKLTSEIEFYNGTYSFKVWDDDYLRHEDISDYKIKNNDVTVDLFNKDHVVFTIKFLSEHSLIIVEHYSNFSERHHVLEKVK